MLNGYIKYDDILNLLKNTEFINGHVNKMEFQRSIASLKIYKKPKYPNIKKIHDTIGNINIYINSFIGSKNQTELDLMNSKEFKSYNFDKLVDVENNLLDPRYIIFNKKNLLKILNLSIKTFAKYEKIGIIIEQTVLACNKKIGAKLEYKVYNLENIIKNLKHYKSDT